MLKDQKTVPEVEKEIAAFVSGIPTTIENQQQFNEAEGNFVVLRKRKREITNWFEEKIIRPARTTLQGYQAEAKEKLAPIIQTETKLLVC